MQQLANFATSQLNGAINASVTSLVVDDGTVFPATGDFYVSIEDEILKCIARSINILTVVRGQDGTTGASHADDSLIKLTLNKAALEDYMGERVQCGPAASRPSTARNGTRYYATDYDYAWLYEGGWSLIHPVYLHYSKAMNLTGWTSFNLGTSTWTVTNGILDISMPANSGENVRGYSKNLPSAPYTLNLVVREILGAGQFNGFGFALYDNTKFSNITYLTNSNRGNISMEQMHTITSYASTPYRQPEWSSGAIWLKIQDDNTNWKFSYSNNGVDYSETLSQTRNTFLTATKVALYANRTENLAYHLPNWMSILGYWEN